MFRIRIRISRIRMFSGLPDPYPDPLVRGIRIRGSGFASGSVPISLHRVGSRCSMLNHPIIHSHPKFQLPPCLSVSSVFLDQIFWFYSSFLRFFLPHGVDELKILSNLQMHLNLVNLLGACTSQLSR